MRLGSLPKIIKRHAITTNKELPNATAQAGSLSSLASETANSQPRCKNSDRTVSGVLWAVFQNNAGGAWDNAKKSFEAGVMINGKMTYKGSDAHKAAVTGDTVGDPFKDTSGPSMNILIKLTCLIGLVIAPILGEGSHENETAAAQIECCSETGTCDLSNCSEMTKEECEAMCNKMNCSEAEKAMCLSQYDENGNYQANINENFINELEEAKI